MSQQMLTSNDKLQGSNHSPSNKIDCRKHLGVCKTEPGIWGASLLHPVSGRLNSYDTQEEAADAFIDKKLDYQSLAIHNTRDSMDTKPDIHGANIQDAGSYESGFDSVVTNDLSRKKELMDQTQMSSIETKLRVRRQQGSGTIYLLKSGRRRWRAEICHRNSRVYVGNYHTYEEADAALNKKRQEIDAVAAGEDRTPATRRQPAFGIHKKREDLESMAHVEMVSEEDRAATSKQSSALVACNQDAGMQTSTIRPRGVYQRKSGKWFCEIRNPVTKRRGCVGSFDTAEQALEALERKRCEFDVLKNAEKKRKKSNCKVEVIEWEVVATKSWDDECGRDCSAKVDDAQLPCLPVDTDVINADGQLVGEFSRLDDDMQLVESLDDAVEYRCQSFATLYEETYHPLHPFI